MANEFVARNGLIAQNNSTISGSLTVTQGITGSLLGTASYYNEVDPIFVAKSASLATTGSNTFTGQQIVSSSVQIKGANGLSVVVNDYSGGSNGGILTIAPYGSSTGNTDSYITAKKNGGIGAGTLILQYGIGDKVAIGKTSANDRLDVNGNAIITGSLNVTAGITGSLLGTASYALNAGGGGQSIGQIVAIATGNSNIF